jgi:hypothetical protein
MPGKVFVVVSILGLCVGIASCTKVEERPVPEGSLESTSSPHLDAIPRDYGRLVGVSEVSKGWNALWFEKEDGTIVVVGVDWIGRKMYTTAALIPRK